MDLAHKVETVLKKQQGVLFARRALVYRGTYKGRDIIAPNSCDDPDYVDDRGYVPVEWWVMSNTTTQSAIQKQNEGITKILLDENEVLLTDVITVAKESLFGCYVNSWPLVKVLDIGGRAVTTSFGTEEVPPIPCHVHAGIVTNGRCCMADGKLEAYMMLPTDCPPYNTNLGKVITRLGLKADCTKDKLLAALKQFAIDDSCYTLLKSYQVKPYDCWTIEPGVVHAPGPWPTLEVQRPQDDANHLAWQLAQPQPDPHKQHTLKHAEQLRGFIDEQDLLNQAVDFNKSIDVNFEAKFRHKCVDISEGKWGRQFQIFYGEFYGEALEVEPGMKWARKKDERPYMGIVWSGKGFLQQTLAINAEVSGLREFLVTPHSELEIDNSNGTDRLLIYTVFPMKT